jgi:hypothetical protein
MTFDFNKSKKKCNTDISRKNKIRPKSEMTQTFGPSCTSPDKFCVLLLFAGIIQCNK